jgi:hypothetical protein
MPTPNNNTRDGSEKKNKEHVPQFLQKDNELASQRINQIENKINQMKMNKQEFVLPEIRKSKMSH